jgi:hypothetical protein
METMIITPQIINNQYFFTIPDELKEQDIEIRIIIHYKPHKNKLKKSDNISKFAGIFKNSKYVPLKNDWYGQ